MKYGIIELHDSYDFNTPIAYKELVRCEECIHYCYDDRYKCYECYHEFGLGEEVKPNYFCSYGERRE